MQPAGTVVCFLCKGFVSYKNKDSSKFQKHMNNEHMAYFGMEYLLAGCTMSEEERLAVKDVIKDRIEPDSESDLNTTLEEEAEEDKKPKETVDEEEHIAKKHPKKISKSVEILDAIDKRNSNSEGDFNKVMKSFKSANESLKKTNIATLSPATSKGSLEKVVQSLSAKKTAEEVEIKRKNLTSTTPVPKKKSLTVVKKGQNANNSLIAEPNQTAGDGTVCPICSKEFPKNGPMRRHFEDIHQPGEFPCSGCQKMFTSKNKMSSHYSRHCNPLNPNSTKRKSL